MTPEEERNRRVSDEIMPIIMLEVERKLTDTRHGLRNEFTEALIKVQAAQVEALRPVTTAVDGLATQVQQLVRDNDRESGHEEAMKAVRKTIWQATGAIIGVGGVVVGFVTFFFG